MPPNPPRWRRRSAARPSEILAAALEVFGERGVSASPLDEIAKRAGVSKSALYLYYENKDDIVAALLHTVVMPKFETLANAGIGDTFSERLRVIVAAVSEIVTTHPFPAVLKIVLAESKNYPLLTTSWSDDVFGKFTGDLAAYIAAAQSRGEVRPGDPKTYAFSLIGPVLMGALLAECFDTVNAGAHSLREAAALHAEAMLYGIVKPSV